jgi:thiamine biosynthesis lipoprotein
MAATVIGPDLGVADAYATALMVRGTDGLDWLVTKPGYDALVITPDRDVVLTAGIDHVRLGRGAAGDARHVS